MLWQCCGSAMAMPHGNSICRCHAIVKHYYYFLCPPTIKFRKKKLKQTKNVQGVVLMAGASMSWKFVKSTFSQGIWRGSVLAPAFDFLRLFATSFELRAVDNSVFCHLSPRLAPPAPPSLSHNLRRHRSPSRRPARGCVSYFLCPA